MNHSQENKETAADSPTLYGRFADLLDAHPDAVLIGTALVVGVLTGIGAVIFNYLIDGVAQFSYEWVPDATSSLGKAYVIFVPAIGGIFVGLLVYYFASEAKGHGVPEVMEAVAIKGGRIRPRVAIVKALASSITIGTGGSAGREGPIVQIGSGLGSTLGQVLKLSPDRISNLVACGAAAGIATIFNAPIAGVIFSLEIISGRFTVRYFSSVVVAAVSASVIGRVALGDAPSFIIPHEYGVNSLWEFLFYPFLGIAAALVGVTFTRTLYWVEDFFDDIKIAPEWTKPAIGGALLGVLAFAYPLIRLAQPVTWTRVPQIYNVGHDIIESALDNQMLLGAALILLVAKILATDLTLGSGGSGGVFAPALFMGAMLGAVFQSGVDYIFPGISAPQGAYAVLGMAAVFASATHAPITAVIILFELTGDYQLILPLMLTVVVATLLSQKLLHGESIYTIKLTRRGIRLERGRDRDILQGVTVDEVMSHHVDPIFADRTIKELADMLVKTHHHGLMVLGADGKLEGVVTISDLDKARREKLPEDTPVSAIATTWPRLKVAYPDETMGDALARMGARGLGRLPVVSRDDPYQLLGVVRRSAITQAYDLALTRRSEIKHKTENIQSQFAEEAEFVDILLVEDDSVIGKSVAEVAPYLPDDCVLVSIKRNNSFVIPHGDTVFQVGDQVTAFIRSQDADLLFHYLHGPDENEPVE
ncbi:MAG: chloride channel protein [Candidatus Promineifilaceae bacterium]